MSKILPIRFAEAQADMTAFGNVVNPLIKEIIYPAIIFLFGLAIVIFTYGVLQIVFHGDDAAARDKGKKTMIWGTIGLFLMVSAWSIVYLISDTIKGF